MARESQKGWRAKYYPKGGIDMALSPKQMKALELLTCGKGLTYKVIAEEVDVSPKTLWNWRYGKDFTEFQEELKKLNDDRWMAAVDAAREGAISLCRDGNQKMIEFVLKNEGFNPTQKVEADLSSTITINIGDGEEE